MEIPKLRIPFTEDDISEITGRIREILETGKLAMGKNVREFEEKFSRFCGTKYCIGTNNGTSALEVALRCFDVKDKSVIVPTNTFMASVFAPVHAGARVKFVDVTKDDLSIDPDDLNEKIQKDTKAVILVHVGGIISFNLKKIMKICEDNNVLLLEDAAHAHGASFDGDMAGSFGEAAAFSFYPTKVITCGEGGAITTDSSSINNMARTWIDEGKPDTNVNKHTVFGNNWRLAEINATVALSQLKKIDWILSERRKIAGWYDKKLRNVSGINLLRIPNNIKPSYYKYIVYLDNDIDRSAIKKELLEKFDVNLSGEVYEFPCHNQPVFNNNPWAKINKDSDQFPGAEYVCERHICLPLYPGLSENEVDYIVNSLKEVL